MQFEGKSPKHCMRLLNRRQRKYILFFKLSQLPMSDLKKKTTLDKTYLEVSLQILNQNLYSKYQSNCSYI